MQSHGGSIAMGSKDEGLEKHYTKKGEQFKERVKK